MTYGAVQSWWLYRERQREGPGRESKKEMRKTGVERVIKRKGGIDRVKE